MKPNTPIDDLNELETTKEKLGKDYVVFLVLVGLLLLISGFLFFNGYRLMNANENGDLAPERLNYVIDSLTAIPQPSPDTTYVDTVH